jgi:hypothetical protein
LLVPTDVLNDCRLQEHTAPDPPGATLYYQITDPPPNGVDYKVLDAPEQIAGMQPHSISADSTAPPEMRI